MALNQSSDINPEHQESSGSGLLSSDDPQTNNTWNSQEDSGVNARTNKATGMELENIKTELAIIQNQINRGLALTKDRAREVEKTRKATKTERKEIRQKIEDYLKCAKCSAFMSNPYTVHLCGHSLCATCLLELFEYEKRMVNDDDRETWAIFAKPVTDKLVQDMDGDQELLSGRQQLTTVFHPSYFMRSIYTCAYCGEFIHTRPILNFSLKAIATALHGESPAPDPTIWDPYFPRPFDYDNIENVY